MNALHTGTVRWSTRRWVRFSMVLVLVQVGLLWWLTSRGLPPARRAAPMCPLSLVDDNSLAYRQWTEQLTVHDPTLFALAHPRNFSGSAWLNETPLQLEIWTWRDKDHWFDPGQPPPDTHFLQSNASRQAVKPIGLEKPAPPLSKLAVTNPQVATQSWFRVEGELAGRLLMASPALPAWTNSEAIGPTTVQVVVTGEGRPFLVELRSSSGWPPADQKAVRLAGAMQFQPSSADGADAANGPRLSWGWVTFHWLTVAASSNSPGPPR